MNRITEEDVTKELVDIEYYILPGTTTTVCVLTGKTGWTTTGFCACADVANFDKATGEKWAYKDAFNKWYQLLAFRLKDSLYFLEGAGSPTKELHDLGEVISYTGSPQLNQAVKIGYLDYCTKTGVKPMSRNNTIGYAVQVNRRGDIRWCSADSVELAIANTGHKVSPKIDLPVAEEGKYLSWEECCELEPGTDLILKSNSGTTHVTVVARPNIDTCTGALYGRMVGRVILKEVGTNNDFFSFNYNLYRP